MATEERLVDANRLIAEFEWLQSQVSSERAIELKDHIQRIKDAPTVDAVPVVMCKDCCRGELYSNRPAYIFCKEHHRLVEKDDFCSYGERKGS